MRRQRWLLKSMKRLAGVVRRQLLWRCGKYRFARTRAPGLCLCCIHASHAAGLKRGEEPRLRALAAQLDGLLLRPGETFSCWRTLGWQYRGGDADELAGLLLWMALHTPLTVEECHLSGGDGSAVGAACVYPQRDLMLTNDTSQCFQLRLEVSGGELRGAWLCDYEPYVHYQVVGRGQLYRQMVNPYGEVLLEEAV